MAGPLATKLRLVRCPICRRVLPELPNIPVYKCGECNTVLQAKKCKNDTKDTDLQIPDVNIGKENVLEHGSEYKEARSLSKEDEAQSLHREETVSSTGEKLPLEKNNVSDGKEDENININQFGVTQYENEESSPEAREEAEVDEENGGVKFSDEVASSTELYHLDSEESSPVAGAHSQVDESGNYLEQGSVRIQNEDGICNVKQTGCVNFSHEVDESRNYLEQESVRNQNEDSLHCGRDRSAFGDFKRDWRRNTKFSNDYGYESSVSSYGGNDDQVPDRYLNLLRRKNETKSSIAKTVHKRDEVMNRITSYPEMEHQALIRSEKSHYTTKGKWHQDELMEPMRRGPPIRRRMIFESGGYRSRVPLYSRGSQAGYETGGPSNYRQEEFQCCTRIHSANKPEKKSEEEKMELMKMVFELQDELKRTSISKGVEMYPRRCIQGKRCPHQYRTSRIPFSAEANMSRYTKTEPHSCFHCPRDWQSSAPLSPHVCCNKSHHYKAHQSTRYCNLYSSNPCSPQYSTSSEFSLQSYDANSDDCERQKYDRERNRLKRHIRPLAGGAPFVICYLCWELLLLPLDFLQSKRRFHQLRCSACSNTLKFSLEDRTCIHPYTDDYTPDAKAPPPSEVDDYGPSLGKTCSTEGEPFSVGLPFQAAKRDSYGRKMLSGSSFEHTGENSMEMFAAAGPSSKMSKVEKNSPEIEELRQVSVSPLHRLMGYTSPSEVMQR